uniref:Uncharacterized protein n=1 Tax=Anguilla anguilla TaxID=7936 RepID=A0A0E9RD81_ANGAN
MCRVMPGTSLVIAFSTAASEKVRYVSLLPHSGAIAP